MQLIYFLSFIVYIIFAKNVESSDLFTAIVDLKKVLHAEREIAENLKDYIELEKFRLNKLSELVQYFSEHSQQALLNAENHVSNPVNAFQLVKRFTSDWDDIYENHIRSKAANVFFDRLKNITAKFPDKEDLSGAATALLRLQDTYALLTEEVARGDLLGKQNSPPMTVDDCFVLGKVAYEINDFYHTILWMKEALNLIEKGLPSSPFLKSEVLDYLSYAMYKQGNTAEAFRLTNEFLLIEPNHERILRNREFYRGIMKDEKITPINDEVANKKESSKDLNTLLKNEKIMDGYKSSVEFNTYERLCRDEKTHIYRDEYKLKCYNKRHHPMFYILPLREEEVYLKPKIVIFHNSVFSQEIDMIKDLALPNLNRATVQNSQTGKLETATYRVSKSAWLRDPDNLIISHFSQRSKAITNLTLDTVEELQVVNYGIGGHYEPHFDFARKYEVHAFETWRGNRIVTFLCYLSDVSAGGFTVFPEIGVQLKPRKGLCTLWHNLFKNGDGDHDTRHAACPVLTGNKWIANKWYHERGQEFARPCSLNPDE